MRQPSILLKPCRNAQHLHRGVIEKDAKISLTQDKARQVTLLDLVFQVRDKRSNCDEVVTSATGVLRQSQRVIETLSDRAFLAKFGKVLRRGLDNDFGH